MFCCTKVPVDYEWFSVYFSKVCVVYVDRSYTRDKNPVSIDILIIQPI